MFETLYHQIKSAAIMRSADHECTTGAAYKAVQLTTGFPLGTVHPFASFIK